MIEAVNRLYNNDELEIVTIMSQQEYDSFIDFSYLIQNNIQYELIKRSAIRTKTHTVYSMGTISDKPKEVHVTLTRIFKEV